MIDSPRIATTLERADRRGVAVRVILARAWTTPDGRRASPSPRPSTPRLPGRASICPRTRPPDAVHEKTFRSRVQADWVTMTGSYNASDTADTASYATMWQVTERPDIYDAFAEIAAQQRAQRTLPTRTVSTTGDDWSAYFLPSGPLRPAKDPVVARLARIPARAELGDPDRDVLDVGRPRRHGLAERLAAAVARGSAGHLRGRPAP